ncbi:MAG: hypothetical protein AseanaTS_18620 [Candidatus Pelagadaptatus aseana]
MGVPESNIACQAHPQLTTGFDVHIGNRHGNVFTDVTGNNFIFQNFDAANQGTQFIGRNGTGRYSHSRRITGFVGNPEGKAAVADIGNRRGNVRNITTGIKSHRTACGGMTDLYGGAFSLNAFGRGRNHQIAIVIDDNGQTGSHLSQIENIRAFIGIFIDGQIQIGRVTPVLTGDHIGVIASATRQRVSAVIATQNVIACATGQGIVTFTTIDPVIPLTGIKIYATAITAHNIHAIVAGNFGDFGKNGIDNIAKTGNLAGAVIDVGVAGFALEHNRQRAIERGGIRGESPCKGCTFGQCDGQTGGIVDDQVIDITVTTAQILGRLAGVVRNCDQSGAGDFNTDITCQYREIQCVYCHIDTQSCRGCHIIGGFCRSGFAFNVLTNQDPLILRIVGSKEVFCLNHATFELENPVTTNAIIAG